MKGERAHENLSSRNRVKKVFKEIPAQPEQIFEMMRAGIKESIGQYLSELMRAELHHYLGGQLYERKEGETDHRKGSYERRFTLKRLAEVSIR